MPILPSGVSARQARKFLRVKNSEWPEKLQEIPREKWPAHALPKAPPFRVMRSSRFLVQLFHEKDGVIRLSATRTALSSAERFADGISWDDLQNLKAEAGYGDQFGVEIYPPDGNVINVANMRHLWILSEPLALGWRNR